VIVPAMPSSVPHPHDGPQHEPDFLAISPYFSFTADLISLSDIVISFSFC
jgi:hypothetical protein